MKHRVHIAGFSILLFTASCLRAQGPLPPPPADLLPLPAQTQTPSPQTAIPEAAPPQSDLPAPQLSTPQPISPAQDQQSIQQSIESHPPLPPSAVAQPAGPQLKQNPLDALRSLEPAPDEE